MKKLCLLIAVITFTAITTFAQEGAKIKNEPAKQGTTTASPGKPIPAKKPMKRKVAKKPVKATAVAAPKAK